MVRYCARMYFNLVQVSKSVDVFVTSEDILMYVIVVVFVPPSEMCFPPFRMELLCIELEVQPSV